MLNHLTNLDVPSPVLSEMANIRCVVKVKGNCMQLSSWPPGLVCSQWGCLLLSLGGSSPRCGTKNCASKIEDRRWTPRWMIGEKLVDIWGKPPWSKLLFGKLQTVQPSWFCQHRRGTPCGLLWPARRRGCQVGSCRSRRPTLTWSASFWFPASQFGNFWKSDRLVFRRWGHLGVALVARVDLWCTWNSTN